MVALGNGKQTKEGILAVWKNKWDAIRGGFIGAFIGLLPGLGGAVADWMAYSSTVDSHPKDKFGEGNIKGIGISKHIQADLEAVNMINAAIQTVNENLKKNLY